MSIKLGKSNNWGSRTGSIKKTSKNNSILEKLKKAGLPNDLITDLLLDLNETQKNLELILNSRSEFTSPSQSVPLKKYFKTKQGELFQGSCFDLLNKIEDNSIDCIFADPPFNLSKDYNNGQSDLMSESEYLEWSRTWIDLSIKKLKPGGSFFLYNIPKWNVYLSNYMSQQLNFRHWITVDMTFSMPIPSKLYPSHYSLLYYIKGDRPNCFNPPRVPIKTCVKCGQEQNDYGGYKSKMHPEGINIRDVWTDINPVRHAKYKNRDANELPIKLLDRIIDIATNEGDLVFDPFGGSGTTYIVAELKNRKWIGSELGDCTPIKERFDRIKEEKVRLDEIRSEINTLFTDRAIELRLKSGIGLKNYNVTDEQLERVLDRNPKFKQMELNN